MGVMKNVHKILVGKPEGKRPLENLGLDGKIILKWDFGKWGGKLWTRCIWHRMGTNDGLF
jgi:hypothetical protein